MFVALQDSYSLLQKLDVAVARDETERVDTLRYSWHNLQQQVRETAARLADLEPHFKRQLIVDVTALTNECNHFCRDYHAVSRYGDDDDDYYYYMHLYFARNRQSRNKQKINTQQERSTQYQQRHYAYVWQ